MFGLIVKFRAHEGKRDDFIRVLSEGFQDMKGCHSYILAADPADDTAVWATEIWDSEEAHKTAMAEPRIKDVIAKGKPFMAGRDLRVVTEPRGGQGL
ncbi:MAG TPA: putative quinol monooxygenase [Caulobacteraceae bacterium]|jgi:quinol monooxygenase YgiN